MTDIETQVRRLLASDIAEARTRMAPGATTGPQRIAAPPARPRRNGRMLAAAVVAAVVAGAGVFGAVALDRDEPAETVLGQAPSDTVAPPAYVDPAEDPPVTTPRQNPELAWMFETSMIDETLATPERVFAMPMTRPPGAIAASVSAHGLEGTTFSTHVGDMWTVTVCTGLACPGNVVTEIRQVTVAGEVFRVVVTSGDKLGQPTADQVPAELVDWWANAQFTPERPDWFVDGYTEGLGELIAGS